jgi:hypothetical protein
MRLWQTYLRGRVARRQRNMSTLYLVLAAFLAALLAMPRVGAQESHELRRQRREIIDSLLKSTFERTLGSREDPDAPPALPAFSKRRDRPLSAPLAHPTAPTSDSFHLLRVTGAKASLGAQPSADAEDFAGQASEAVGGRYGLLEELKERSAARAASEALGKKYEFLRELKREFEK